MWVRIVVVEYKMCLVKCVYICVYVGGLVCVVAYVYLCVSKYKPYFSCHNTLPSWILRTMISIIYQFFLYNSNIYHIFNLYTPPYSPLSTTLLSYVGFHIYISIYTIILIIPTHLLLSVTLLSYLGFHAFDHARHFLNAAKRMLGIASHTTQGGTWSVYLCMCVYYMCVLYVL